jgi:ABC-type uncharacterized transport system substrate-binding protein
MDHDLHAELQHLHTQLSQTSNVDPESRALLVTLLGDITRLLEQSTGGTPAHEGELSLPDRMESVAVHFETEHPSLSAAIRGVIDALARAGV